MARVASFTSAGTPASGRGTLAELMARRKLLQEQQGDILAPRQIESWTQGAAQLAQTLVNGLQQRRAARELSEGREQMAAAMAGIDWTKGATPEQLQAITALDPEAGQRIMETAAQRALEEYKYNREVKRSDFEWNRTQADQEADEARQAAAQAKVEADKRAYAEKQKAAELAGQKVKIITGPEAEAAGYDPNRHWRVNAAGTELEDVTPENKAVKTVTGAEAEALGYDGSRTWEIPVAGGPAKDVTVEAEEPATQLGKLKADLDAGRITPEQYDAAVKKETTQAGVGGPANLKVLYDQQDQYINTSSAIGQLDRAKQLLDQGIITGYGAGLKTDYSAMGLPGGDEAAAARTKEYNSIMNTEAITAMSQSLKGATTDTELALFIKNLNDPTLAPEVKARQIDTMMAKARAFNEMQAARIKQMDPTVELPSQTAAVPPEEEQRLLQAARDAIANKADPALVKKRLVDKGIDPGKL